jgi:hypothetical protein
MKIILSLLLFIFFSFSNFTIKQGTVKGKLCFPSYYIPEMTVYLKNVHSNEVIKLEIQEDQRIFEFKNVLIGKYVAYAYTLLEIMSDESGNSGKGSGGYTQMVNCGLSIDCIDHSLIEFDVKPNQIIQGIEICDWYGANIPSEYEE